MLSKKKSGLIIRGCAARVDLLESRRLLSAVLGSDGKLTVTGTSGDDSIEVDFDTDIEFHGSTGSFTVQLNGTVSSFDAAVVHSVVVNGLGGNDLVKVTGAETSHSTVYEEPVDVVVTDGDGSDDIFSDVGVTGFAGPGGAVLPTTVVTVGNGDDLITESGDTQSTLTAGNGDNQFVVNQSSGRATVATIVVGNGTDQFYAQGTSTFKLTVNATVGTGQDSFSNGNDSNIFINATTTDGQTLEATGGRGFISGRVTIGSGNSATPVAGALVFLDANDNGVVDGSEPFATTLANGDYQLQLISSPAGSYETFDGNLRVADAAYGAPAHQPAAATGLGLSSLDFVLTPVIGQPKVIGTTGSYQNDGNTIAKALDGNVHTYFDAPTSSGAYVGLDYGSPQVISTISYAPRAGWAGRMVGGLFQGSNSASFSNAVTLYKVTAAPAAGSLATIPVTGAFEFVRYIGPSGAFCNIGEMKVEVVPLPNTVFISSIGTLTIAATQQADTVSVNFFDDVESNGSSGTYTVVLNGKTTTWDAGEVTGIAVDGFNGDDNVLVQGTEQNDTLGIPPIINTTISEGSGNNTIGTSVSDVNISYYLGGSGPGVSVTAGDGDNCISVFASGVATVRVGNGNNQLEAGSDGDGVNATFYAGNGNNIISGGGGSVGEDVEAHVGTGQNSFYNQQDPDIRVEGDTSDGQGFEATDNVVSLAGRVYSGTAASPVPISGATVFIDSNNNGILDSGEQSTVTDSNGDYLFEISNTDLNEATLYSLQVANVGFAATPVSYQKSTEGGAGFSGLDFLVAPVASQPVTFGTSGSYQNDGNTIAKALDGNLNTYFDSPTNSGGYVALDYGSPQVFAQIQYAPRAGWASRMVGGVFQGSNSANFLNAVTLFKVTATPTVGVLTLANVTGAGSFRYVRYLGPAGSFCNIAEMDFILAGKLKGTPIGTAGSYHNQGNTIANAFDGNPNTFFDGPDASGDWVGLDVGTGTLKAVEFEARAGFESRMVGGEIQASNSADFSSGVVTLATITSKPVSGAITTLGVSNIYSYRYYRYIGPSNSYCDIAELEFIG